VLTAQVAVMDTFGNIGSALGSTRTVNLTVTPDAGLSASTVTLPASGQPVSGSFTYGSPTGNSWTTETITASVTGSPSLTSVGTTLNK
jgi:hypothetical protein